MIQIKIFLQDKQLQTQVKVEGKTNSILNEIETIKKEKITGKRLEKEVEKAIEEQERAQFNASMDEVMDHLGLLRRGQNDDHNHH